MVQEKYTVMTHNNHLQAFKESLKNIDREEFLKLLREIEAEPQDENELTVGEFLDLMEGKICFSDTVITGNEVPKPVFFNNSNSVLTLADNLLILADNFPNAKAITCAQEINYTYNNNNTQVEFKNNTQAELKNTIKAA